MSKYVTLILTFVTLWLMSYGRKVQSQQNDQIGQKGSRVKMISMPHNLQPSLKSSATESHNVESAVQLYPISYDISGEPKLIYTYHQSYTEVQIVSQAPFTAMITHQSAHLAITGMAIGKPKTNRLQKSNRFINLNQNQIQPDDASLNQIQEQKVFIGTMQLYSLCKKLSISYDRTPITLEIEYQPNNLLDSSKKQDAHLPTKENITLQTVVYCISETSLVQTNFFFEKAYFFFVLFFFGFVIEFKPIKRIPKKLVVCHLLAFTYLSFTYALSDWFATLVLSCFGVIFPIIGYYQCIVWNRESSQYIFTRSMVVVSLAYSLSIIWGGRMTDFSQVPHGFTLYLANFVIILNGYMLVSTIINISRFRHAFYYLMMLVLLEYLMPQPGVFEGSSKVPVFSIIGSNTLPKQQTTVMFSMLNPQIFPVPARMTDLFYVLLIVPVCDFFFEGYTPKRILKFLILAVPVLSRPLYVPVSWFACVVIFLWWISVAVKGDMIKLLKYRRS